MTKQFTVLALGFVLALTAAGSLQPANAQTAAQDAARGTRPTGVPCSRGKLAGLDATGRQTRPTRFTWAVSAEFAKKLCMPAAFIDLPVKEDAAVAYLADSGESPVQPGLPAADAAFAALDRGHTLEIYFERDKVKQNTTQRQHSFRIIQSFDDIHRNRAELEELGRMYRQDARNGRDRPMGDHDVYLVVRIPGEPEEQHKILPFAYQVHEYVGIDAMVLQTHAGFTRNRVIPVGAQVELLLRIKGPVKRFSDAPTKNPPVVYELPFGKRLSALIVAKDQALVKRQDTIINKRVREVTK